MPLSAAGYINTDIIRDMMARRGPEILARVPAEEVQSTPAS